MRNASIEPLERRALLSVSDLDSTFGSNGRVLTDLAGATERAAAVAVQADGKVLVAGVAQGSGYGNTDAVLLRYTSAGALDSSFGTGGIVRLDLSRSDSFTDVEVQSDGKIVVGGTRHQNGYFLARYTSGGALDSTFGPASSAPDGVVIGAGRLTNLALRGSTIVSGGGDVIRRHTSNGALDPSFGNGGSFSVTGGTSIESFRLKDLDLDHAGRVVALGASESNTSYTIVDHVVRLTPDGQPDSSFGGAGYATFDSSGNFAYLDAVAVQPDNKLVLVFNDEGYAYLERINVTGSDDASFATTNVHWGGYEYENVYDAVVQGDGKVVIAGFSQVDYPESLNGPPHVAAARVNVNGGLDTSFSYDGKSEFEWPRGSALVYGDEIFDTAYALAIAPSGQVVLAGASTTYPGDAPGSTRIGVARFDANPAGAHEQVEVRPDGVVVINGTAEVDHIVVTVVGAELDIALQKTEHVRLPLADVTRLFVYAFESNDVVDLSGVSINSTIDGGPGGDNLSGGQGHDIIVDAHDASADWLDGQGGDDYLAAGDGDDHLFGDEGNDSLDAQAGNDHLDGYLGNDVLIAGTGNDDLFGRDGDDSLDGGAGEDVLDGGAGTDTLAGGAGDDIQVNAENAGGNTTNFTLAPDGLLTLNGTLVRDLIVVTRYASEGTIGASIDGIDMRYPIASVSRVSIFGSDGDDFLVIDDELTLPATIIGGAGRDTLTGGGGPNALRGGDDNDVLAGRGAADFLHGDAGDDDIHGNAGNDTLLGGDGEDLLIGGDGTDGLDGGLGNDVQLGGEGAGASQHPITLGADGVLHVPGRDGADDFIKIQSGAGTTSVFFGRFEAGHIGSHGQVDFNTADVTSIRIIGGGGDDQLGVYGSGSAVPMTLDGGAGNDWLTGGDGNDRLIDGDGDDHVFGDYGNDTLVAGTGADDLQAGNGTDTVDYSARTEALNLTADHQADDGAAGEGDYIDTDVERFLGGSGADVIASTSYDTESRNNVMFGNGGIDTLVGGPGGDALFGGAGGDFIDAGHLDYVEADYVEGNAGDDVIVTFARGDTIKAGDGSDVVEVASTGGELTYEGGTRPTDNDTLKVLDGTVGITYDLGDQTARPFVEVETGAAVVFEATQTLQRLFIAPGGSVTMGSHGSRHLYLRQHWFEIGSRLNMTDNDLILDYAPGEPSREFQFRDLVLRARDVGDHGIFFARTDADDTILAFGEASELGVTEFNGVALDGTALLGKYTYYGDANFDGQVTTDDYVAVDLGLGTGDSWVQGDFDLNGAVTTDDYVVVDLNLGKGTNDPLATSEPEQEPTPVHEVETTAKGKKPGSGKNSGRLQRR